MSSLELSSMTVIELRKLAKEKHVRLGAGLSKDGIIQKLTAALAGESTEEATEQVVEETPAAAPETEAKEPAAQEEETPAVQTAQQTSQEAPVREERTASAHFKAACTIPHHVTAPSLPIRLRLILRGLPGRREAHPRHVPRPIRIPFG